ncbi:RDD family protein, partial [Streptomyces alkaliterrae]
PDTVQPGTAAGQNPAAPDSGRPAGAQPPVTAGRFGAPVGQPAGNPGRPADGTDHPASGVGESTGGPGQGGAGAGQFGPQTGHLGSAAGAAQGGASPGRQASGQHVGGQSGGGTGRGGAGAAGGGESTGREESGGRPESGSAWQADANRQSGFGGEQDQRVSWGQPAGTPGSAPAPEQTTQLRRSDIVNARRAARSSGGAAAPAAGFGQPQTGAPQAHPQGAPGAQPGLPAGAVPGGPQLPAQGGPAAAGRSEGTPGWAQQVRDLAQAPGAGAPPGGPGEGPTPWRPPVNDPFLQAAQNQARPAGLGRRLAARLLDSLVTGAVGAAVAFPLLPKTADHVKDKIEAAEHAGVTTQVWLLDGTTGGYLAMVIGAMLVFGLLYEALPNARWGRTLGKKLFGLRVLSLEEQEPPGYGRAVVRWLVQGGSAALLVGVVNLAWALFDKPWRQCLHDKAAGTFTAQGGDAGELRLGG